MPPKSRTPKEKRNKSNENPVLPPPIYMDHLPLIDLQYKIVETNCEFDLFQIHSWLKRKFLDQSDELNLWESILPQFTFPQTHHFPELVSWCQLSYLPSQKAIMSRNGEIMFTIIVEAISQMLQVKIPNSSKPLLVDSLRNLYRNLTFS